MGMTTVTAMIGNSRERLQEVEFLVDTGFFYTLLPPALAEEMQIALPLTASVVLADQRAVDVKLGVAYLRLNGRERGIPMGALSVPMPLLGATALEALGFKVDPIRGFLEPSRPFGPAAL